MWRRLPSVLMLALVSITNVAALAQSKSSEGCLSYEPTVVSLKGKLVRKKFPGPPEYESIRKGDKPETFWLLTLERPLCMNEDREQPDINAAYDGILEVQLVLVPAQYRQYRNLVGQKILATGSLFGEHTIHHRTAVLLTVTNIRRLPAQ
jgi:uncharacterized protein DUF4431